MRGSINSFPIGDNLAVAREVCDALAEGEEWDAALVWEAYLRGGPFNMDDEECLPGMTAEKLETWLAEMDPTNRDDLVFGWSYLHGLGDAWDMTVLQVWEEWEHATTR